MQEQDPDGVVPPIRITKEALEVGLRLLEYWNKTEASDKHVTCFKYKDKELESGVKLELSIYLFGPIEHKEDASEEDRLERKKAIQATMRTLCSRQTATGKSIGDGTLNKIFKQSSEVK